MLLHIYLFFVIINSPNVVENGLIAHESGGNESVREELPTI